jgi:hypothetical protein
MSKEIHIRETAGIDRTDEYVRVAVPCARGEVQPDIPLGMIDPAVQLQPCQVKVLKLWPDGSVKWLLLDCAVMVSAGSTAIYRLATSPDAVPVLAKPVQVTPGADTWQVDTGAGTFTIDARSFRPFVMIRRQTDEVLRASGSSCLLSTNGKSSFTPIVEDICLEDSGPLRAIVHMAGRFELPHEKVLRFSSRLHFFAGSMAVQIEFTLHNPQAARHPGGLWDLGDAGSFLFKGLAFDFPIAAGSITEVRCSPEIGAAPLDIKDVNPSPLIGEGQGGGARFCIYQESSGSKNWPSPNHRNKEGRVPLTRSGYSVEVDDRQVASGLRASPLVWCGANGVGVAAALPYFWQEFPKAIKADNAQLTISLFPARFPDLHELQGGEQKTHCFFLDFAAQPDSLSWALAPVQAMAAPHEYRSSGIFFDLPGEEDLIDRFTTAKEILLKRDMVDEYGWRNFGEIYADHEAVYHQGDEPFVSHYNNQYDVCAGLYRKFWATGNTHWGELASDLARHVLDIDIYHTDLDREEFNGGLFWHTDHYIDAGFSTHRSFSKEHLKKKDSRFCGGGPGAEHCYTSGLMYHYFQTGNPAVRDTVIGLAEWSLRVLAGPATVLAVLKKSIHYLKLLRSTKNGSRAVFPRYPLSRGTGNAITACLDAFMVGGGDRFVSEAESLIRGAVHPGDDIDARGLHDVEATWFYTVLLVAIAKFLNTKNELEQFDAGYVYARDCLLAYAEWMLIHEYAYLEKPEKLEYPNETWAAQDLRKSVIFYLAAGYANPSLRERCLERASFFLSAASEELTRHTSSKFTRPVALMLQNGWVGVAFKKVFPPLCPDGAETNFPASDRPTPYLTFGSVLSRIFSEFSHAVRRTSVKREIAWLKARVRT